jgi:TPP-dependent 2-oxoacid decarboxylase
VGGLNVLNAIAGVYVEKSPVVVVSGAPDRKNRE